MKGQVGEWLPRQPQWQHWGELWSRHELEDDSEVVVEVSCCCDDGIEQRLMQENCAWATAASDDEELEECMVECRTGSSGGLEGEDALDDWRADGMEGRASEAGAFICIKGIGRRPG